MPDGKTTRVKVTMELDVPPEYSEAATEARVHESLHLAVEERGWRVAALAVAVGEDDDDTL
jgi:hypothetical protein